MKGWGFGFGFGEGMAALGGFGWEGRVLVRFWCKAGWLGVWLGLLEGKGVVGVWEGKNKSIGYPLAFVRSFSSLVGLVGLGIGFRGARWLSCFGRVVIHYSVLSWAGGEAIEWWTEAGHEVRGWVYGRSKAEGRRYAPRVDRRHGAGDVRGRGGSGTGHWWFGCMNRHSYPLLLAFLSS